MLGGALSACGVDALATLIQKALCGSYRLEGRCEWMLEARQFIRMGNEGLGQIYEKHGQSRRRMAISFSQVFEESPCSYASAIAYPYLLSA